MKPANQKIMVMPSAARMRNLCAAVGKRAGATMRKASARIVHEEEKRRKFTSAGEIWCQWPVHQFETRGVSVGRVNGDGEGWWWW